MIHQHIMSAAYPDRLPNLASLLNKMSDEWKAEIAKLPAFAGKLQSERTLIDVLQDFSTLSELYRQLSLTEQIVLRELVKTFLRFPFRDEEATDVALSARIAAPYARLALLKLRQKGILYALNNRWGESMLFLPADTISVWHRICFTDFGRKRNDSEDAAAIDRSGGLYEKIFDFLSYVDQHALQMTKNGTIHRRQMSKLEQLLTEPEAKTGRDSLIRLVFAIAASERLIRLEEGAWTIDESQVRLFFTRTRSEIERLLYDRVTERFLSSLDKDDRLLVHFVYWTAHLPADRWHDADEFSHWLDQHEIDKKDGGEKISEYIDRWIQQLDECGWIEWRPANRTFRWLWKAFEMNSDECPLYVQPNLEIVVPPSIFPLDRWDVEKFAERTTGGPVARYMLTKQSVARANRHWDNVDDLCIWLEARSKYGLPELVQQTLKWWWQTRPSSARKEVQNLGALKQSGWEQNEASTGVRPEWVIDPRFPRLEQLYPGLENVPQSWWSEPAAYHSSTVRAVVHQALLWGTPILVEANGAWMTLRPQRIDEKADWTVWGPDGQGEPRRMSGKKISKIALLLPGLNDEIAERYHPEQNLFAL